MELISTYLTRFKQLRANRSFRLQQEGVVFECPQTLRKQHNLALQGVNKSLLDRREVALPHIVHVGVTTICNLRCPACPTGTKALGRKGEHLDFDVFAAMVDELRGSLMLMLFWDWGEPLIHPRLADMIAHANQSGIRSVVSTNGTIGNSSEELEKLVRAGLDLMIVCVDGASQASHESYRVGGRLADVLATVERLAEVREKVGSATPAIEFRTLATKHNESEMPELLRLAEKSGADFFTVKSLRPYDYRGHDIDNELVPLSGDLARFSYFEGREAPERVQPARQGPLRCGKPMYAPTLNSSGELAFCSYARYEDENFGSIEGGFNRVWRSADARGKRSRYLELEGTRSCEYCFFRSDHRPPILYTVPMKPMPPGLSLHVETSPGDFLKAVS